MSSMMATSRYGESKHQPLLPGLRTQVWLAGFLLLSLPASVADITAFAADNASADLPKSLLGKVRAELTLDEIDGRLTYTIRNVSDGPVKIHGLTLQFAHTGFCVEPVAEVEAIADDDHVDTEEGAVYVLDGLEMMRRAPLDRAIDLMPGESLSSSVVIQDLPWFESLISQLKKRKFKQYRIDPRVIVYTADDNGKPVMDHHIEVWNFERGADGGLHKVHFTRGIMLTLPQAVKLKAKARDKSPDAANTD